MSVSQNIVELLQNTIEFLAFVAIFYLLSALYDAFQKDNFRPLAYFAWMCLGVAAIKWGVRLIAYIVAR